MKTGCRSSRETPFTQNSGHPQNTSYFVFLDDGDHSRTEKQVANEFSNKIRNSVKSSLSILPKESKTIEDPHFIKIEMPGSDCNERLNCVIYYDDELIKIETKANTPSYLGSQKLVSTRTGANTGISFVKLPKGINEAVLAKTISEQLPSWIYWYIPTGYLGNNPFPLMLNQGKALFFVKPKEGDAIPVLPHVAARLEAAKKATGETTPVPLSASGIHQTPGLAN